MLRRPGAVAPRGRGLDDEACAKLYAAQSAPLLELLARLTGDRRIAVELWAETLAHSVVARGRFRGRTPEDAAAWLEAIAYRQLARLRFHGHVEPVSLRRLGLDAPTEDCPDMAASFVAQLLPEHSAARMVG